MRRHSCLNPNVSVLGSDPLYFFHEPANRTFSVYSYTHSRSATFFFFWRKARETMISYNRNSSIETNFFLLLYYLAILKEKKSGCGMVPDGSANGSVPLSFDFLVFIFYVFILLFSSSRFSRLWWDGLNCWLLISLLFRYTLVRLIFSRPVYWRGSSCPKRRQLVYPSFSIISSVVGARRRWAIRKNTTHRPILQRLTYSTLSGNRFDQSLFWPFFHFSLLFPQTSNYVDWVPKLSFLLFH